MTNYEKAVQFLNDTMATGATKSEATLLLIDHVLNTSEV